MGEGEEGEDATQENENLFIHLHTSDRTTLFCYILLGRTTTLTATNNLNSPCMTISQTKPSTSTYVLFGPYLLQLSPSNFYFLLA